MQANFCEHIDESTTIKNPTAKRTKAIVVLGKEAYYKRILTGSPVTNSPLDLFSQCQFLNDSLIESASYYSFKNRYAVMRTHNFGGRRVQLVHSYQRLDELASILKKFSFLGKLFTDSVKYSYAFLSLEIIFPIIGRMYKKY